jgi:hypothetical protein
VQVKGGVVHPTLPYARDVAAQMFVAAFFDGASPDAVGEALGITGERARQIEAGALAKLAIALPSRGITSDVIEGRAPRERRRLASGHLVQAPEPSRAFDEPAPPEMEASEFTARIDALLREVEARAGWVSEVTRRAADAAEGER